MVWAGVCEVEALETGWVGGWVGGGVVWWVGWVCGGGDFGRVSIGVGVAYSQEVG